MDARHHVDEMPLKAAVKLVKQAQKKEGEETNEGKNQISFSDFWSWSLIHTSCRPGAGSHTCIAGKEPCDKAFLYLFFKRAFSE